MGTAHLILGKTTDYLTGQTLVDTHDERARQAIARFLVEEKGYAKTEIRARQSLRLELHGQTGTVGVDFVIEVNGRPLMLVLFRPGSVVSRRRPAIAAARIFGDKTIPYAVITNGDEAEILDTASGRLLGTGLQAIFSRNKVLETAPALMETTLTQDHAEKEKRILFAMEVLTQKECDDYTCQNG